MQVWNFLPLFVDNGDFIFQDLTGKAYRLDLRTGAVRLGLHWNWFFGYFQSGNFGFRILIVGSGQRAQDEQHRSKQTFKRPVASTAIPKEPSTPLH